MSYEAFIPKAFNPKHRAIIAQADKIMRAYASQGYDLSLRQLYYQFIAHHATLFPANGPGGTQNTEQNYKMLGKVISDARLAGQLDWDSLVDRGRNTVKNATWETPADIVEAAAKQFRIDLWENQRYHVEVMVEKQALEGVLVPVCRRLDVHFTANKGYSSSSAMYEAGKRIQSYIDKGKDAVVIYLGDHDPSGIDMTRDVDDRLALFCGVGRWVDEDWELDDLGLDKPGVFKDPDVEDRLQIVRVALNMDQVRRFNPPPNPAKMTDSRVDSYIRKYGRESWELDALDPATLAGLVETTIASYIDPEPWDEREALLKEGRDNLLAMAKKYREENS